MIKRIFTLILFAVLVLSSGCNKDKQKMEVVKDCTGVYLRSKSGLDYKVCNDELLASHPNGKKLKVTFETLEECFGLLEPPSCSDSHTISGVIEITEIFN